MSDTLRIDSSFSPKLIDPLLRNDARYIVLYGGRGGSKSWNVARSLLIRATLKRIRVLCCREYMANMNESVHKLLCDQIVDLGLSSRFRIEKAHIYGTNGSEFSFAGIRNNPHGLKSYEGVDVAWCEESASCTYRSWEILIPTIRKNDSQIIVTFNPELASDETWKRFVVSPPPNSVVVKINYDENPFCPQVLLDEAEYLKESDPDAYQNVWLGYPRVYLENAVYGKEIRLATEEGRICNVQYDPLVPVHTFWDLGWRDSTSIIMAQQVGSEFHVIDFLEGTQTTTVEYLRMLQAKPYVFGTFFLPHDAVAKEKGSGRSIEEIIRSHGKTVHVIKRLAVNDGIHAAKVIFDRCWFDERKCADLLQHLRKYAWDMKKMPDGEYIASARPEPVHGSDSHAADAFRYMAIGLQAPKKQFSPRIHIDHGPPSSTGWMR